MNKTTRSAGQFTVRHYRKENGKFVIAPVEILTDRRLTDADRRMLLALMLFARGKSAVWPSRETLAEFAGINVGNVSKRVRRLIELDWVTRRRRGCVSNLYELHLPTGTSQIAAEVANATERVPLTDDGQIDLFDRLTDAEAVRAVAVEAEEGVAATLEDLERDIPFSWGDYESEAPLDDADFERDLPSP